MEGGESLGGEQRAVDFDYLVDTQEMVLLLEGKGADFGELKQPQEFGSIPCLLCVRSSEYK